MLRDLIPNLAALKEPACAILKNEETTALVRFDRRASTSFLYARVCVYIYMYVHMYICIYAYI